MYHSAEEQAAVEIRLVLDRYHSGSSNDESLLAEIEHIVHRHGDGAYSCLLYTIASINKHPEDAKHYWAEIVAHRNTLNRKLGRPVQLIPALLDFLSQSAAGVHHLKLVTAAHLEEITNDTIHDGLTAIFNRNYFLEVLEQQIDTARRYDTEFSLLFMDVDDFKEINDSYGHQIGDYALRQIAAVMSQEKRGSDTAARYGGEEFVLLMPHTCSVDALTLAERIRSRVAELRLNAGESSFSVTISGGISSFPVNGQSSSELLRNADSALYQAKGAGKDTISQYKPDKRRFLRVKYIEKVQVKELGFNSTDHFSGVSKDICAGGILFENSRPLPIGMRIQVSIPVRNVEPLLLIGTVVRVEAFAENLYDIGMAISFKEMEKIANHEISRFLKKKRRPD